MAARELVGAVRRRLALGTRARAARDGLISDQYARWRTKPIRQGTVLYEAFSGNGVLDNPEAIFRHLLDQPDLAHLHHTWVLDDLEKHPEVTAEFADHPRVDFVQIRSAGYFKAMATTQYLVNNATFPQEFAKRPGQTYLNTWHGVPLKHMGFDMPGGGPTSRNITRNFLNADYLVSANEFMTRTMYRNAYRMQGIFPGAVIEEGHPRSDRQVQAVKDPDAVRALLEQRGVELGDRRILLYAPTWRGESFQDPLVNAGQLVKTVKELRKAVDPEQHVVLLKVHQVVFDAVRERMGEVDFLVPNSVPTNLVLGVTDVLVTDYSSIFFDFLATGRPVLHYVPDLAAYRSGRGLYLREDELLGPVHDSLPALLDDVRAALAEPTSARAAEGGATYCPLDDGSVCERIADVVFRGKDESGYRVLRDFGTEKEKLLVYLGSLKSQGITTSALNLLRNLDHEKYDVTAFYVFSRGRDRLKNAALVDPRVRVIPRASMYNATRKRIRTEVGRLMSEGLPENLDAEHVRFWKDEWQRMFGDARFDHLIDFSGYGCFSPFLYSVAEAEHKSIWLHNDMMSDMQRETIGEKHLEDRLSAVFSTYKYFDHLVSVSRELDRVNQKGLAAYATPEKFTWATNTMDGQRVLEMAGVAADTADSAGPDTVGDRPATAEFDTRNVAAAVSSLLEYFDSEAVVREARNRARLGGQEAGTTTFVCVGRLSPEKNHTRLIEAFAQVHERHPEIRLVILGGGKLEDELHDLVARMGLAGLVTLAGQVDNPYAIMADSDCFVLSSDYEGQPMVILEARTLGLPVVTTAFSSVGDSVPPEAGIVVPQTVEGVVEGLEQFLAGTVPASRLDVDAYNAQAIAQFDRAIHGLPQD